jgi:hypothetical protein
VSSLRSIAYGKRFNDLINLPESYKTLPFWELTVMFILHFNFYGVAFIISINCIPNKKVKIMNFTYSSCKIRLDWLN